MYKRQGFRSGHSTETAALRVLSDILGAVDSGDVAALVLLDLSAAFDTVDHAILCRRLQVSYGLGSPVLEWFRSYLYRRSQYVRRLRSSLTHQLDVPQSQCVTVDDRAFAVAGARLWNSLPPDIVASNTLSQFRRQLKTFLFRQSYPSVLLS